MEFGMNPASAGRQAVDPSRLRLPIAARALLDFLSTHRSFVAAAPIDVDRIARELGIAVSEEVDLKDLDTTGRIFFKEERPQVWLNPMENGYGPRRRFTLAHEIGHYCLHLAKDGRGSFVDSKLTMSRTSSYWDIKESEANAFAAELLMPTFLISKHGNEIVQQHKATTGTATMPVATFIRELAPILGVSAPALEYRLKAIHAVQ